MKKLDLNNKIAIVTGASSGIGRELCCLLVKKYGCTVYGVARSMKKIDAMWKDLDGKFIPTVMDVTYEKGWQMMAKAFESTNTSPAILINCAGALPEFASLENADTDTYKSIMDLNYFSCVYACKSIMPIMEKGGAVVNVSSASALCPFAGVSAYSASKAALERFSECIGQEKRDLSVSCVMPGFVKTDIMKNQKMKEKDKSLVDRFSADTEKVAKKLLKGAIKRKKRIILGVDGHFLSFMFRTFPRFGPWIITKVVKKSGLGLFEKI